MLNPNQLSDTALTILRALAQNDARRAGCTMALSSIERSSKRSVGDLEVGLADLEIAGLVRRLDTVETVAAVTDEGEAFFRRYYWSCHATPATGVRKEA